MTRLLCLLQWGLMVVVLGIAFVHSYRHGRVTRFSVRFTWIATTLLTGIFAGYAGSLGHPERERWADSFPDGQHLLGMLVLGWMYGWVMGLLAVGLRRILRKEPLFGPSAE